MQPTDRELIEGAAKAMGIEPEWREWVTSRLGKFGVIHHTRNQGVLCNGKHFNPLESKADAFDLMVVLGFAVRVLDKCVFVESDPETLLGQSSVSELEMFGPTQSKEAATMRAITRAAYAVWKEKENE